MRISWKLSLTQTWNERVLSTWRKSCEWQSLNLLLEMKNFQNLSLNSRWKTDLQTANFYEHSLSTTWTSTSKQDSINSTNTTRPLNAKEMDDVGRHQKINCNNFEKPTKKSSKECVTIYPGSAIRSKATRTNVKQAATAPPQNHTQFSCPWPLNEPCKSAKGPEHCFPKLPDRCFRWCVNLKTNNSSV